MRRHVFENEARSELEAETVQKRPFVKSFPCGRLKQQGPRLFVDAEGTVLVANGKFVPRRTVKECVDRTKVFPHHLGVGNYKFGTVFDGPFVQRLEHIQARPVVAIQEAHIFARGMFHTSVAGPGQSLIALADDAKVRVFLGVLPSNAQAAIGGTVVDNDDFQVIKRLVDQRIKTLAKILLHVIDRNDYGDLRVMHDHPSQNRFRQA